MKNRDLQLFILCLLIGVLTPMFFLGFDLYGKEEIEVQFHDIYFVTPPFTFPIIITGPLLFLTFLIYGILTKFKYRLTWVFLGIGICILGLIGSTIYQFLDHLTRI